MTLCEGTFQTSVSYCNICGNRVRFTTMNQRRNARCPICGSLERHRHLYIYLLSLIPFLKGKKFLHFAPERIIKEIILSSAVGVEYYDVDYAPGKATHVADIRNLHFSDGFFDNIMASHVFEHIDDDERAFKELYRVLRPGGMAILLVPYLHQYHKGLYFRTDGTAMPHLLNKNANETFEIPGNKTAKERFALYGQSDHLRIYGLEDFIKRLEKQNFRVAVADPENLPEVLRKDANLIDEIVFAHKD